MDRIPVGHGEDAGVAPCGGGLAAGQDRLFIRKTRLAEVYMHIRQTGNNILVVKVDDPLCIRRGRLARFKNKKFTARHQEVSLRGAFLGKQVAVP